MACDLLDREPDIQINRIMQSMQSVMQSIMQSIMQSMCLTKAVQGKGCQHLVVQPEEGCLACTGARDDASSLQLSQCLPCCCQHCTATGSAWSDEGLLGNQLCLVPMEYDLHCIL